MGCRDRTEGRVLPSCKGPYPPQNVGFRNLTFINRIDFDPLKGTLSLGFDPLGGDLQRHNAASGKLSHRDFRRLSDASIRLSLRDLPRSTTRQRAPAKPPHPAGQ